MVGKVGRKVSEDWTHANFSTGMFARMKSISWSEALGPIVRPLRPSPWSIGHVVGWSWRLDEGLAASRIGEVVESRRFKLWKARLDGGRAEGLHGSVKKCGHHPTWFSS